MTKKKGEINLDKKESLNIYLCGPTVYDHVHVGNLRSIILFDLLRNLLNYLGVKTNWVNNITDIDDKIIGKSQELNRSEKEVSDEYTRAFFSVLSCFRISLKDIIFPRVTDYLEEIKAFIEKMEKKNLTYENNEDVLFDLGKINEQEYGRLSGQKTGNLKRKNFHLKKPEEVSDFVLWKKTEKGKKWDSKWGLGRPGWHTECVVFIDKLFGGNTINIHGGGIDLLFPHHENERIQFLAVNGKELSDIWLHVAHIFWEKEKMSKSLKNVIYAKDFYEKYGSNVLRYIIFSSHYKQTINLSVTLIENGLNYLERLSRFLKRLKLFCYLRKIAILEEKVAAEENSEVRKAIIKVLLDNLGTAEVIYFLEELVVVLNKEMSSQNVDAYHFSKVAADCLWILNLLGMDFPFLLDNEYNEQEKTLIDSWIFFQKERQFLRADEIRNELNIKGILP